jgi:hypothetical protein
MCVCVCVCIMNYDGFYRRELSEKYNISLVHGMVNYYVGHIFYYIILYL